MQDKSNRNILNPQESLEIVELAKSKRRLLDLGMGPIGEKIFTVFRDNNIHLLYFELDQESSNSLAAIYINKFSSVTGIRSFYIALNSKVPLDLQIFNACHEYYHHIDEIQDSFHVTRIGEPDDKLINAKANRFAAEFLLPTETLVTHVRKHNRGAINLDNWNQLMLLRFIAQIQIDYQVPYRMIVKRLREIEAIKEDIFENLLSIDERYNESVYFKIGIALNKEEFIKINSVTEKAGVDADSLGLILQNYDEGLITIDGAVKDLGIFNKKLEDFGYEVEILDDDIDEILDLFGDEE